MDHKIIMQYFHAVKHQNLGKHGSLRGAVRRARYLPYKFTAKEQDEETGLYYYGARYLDAKYSRWLSTDPAVGEYMSGTSADEGGIYNTVNFSLYHYAGNNPLNYTDPNGKSGRKETQSNPDNLANLGHDINSLPPTTSMNSKEITRFTDFLRETAGADYSHKRMPSGTQMDCSGMLVYVLDKMGYAVDKHLTAAKMASGEVPGIELYPDVDNTRQGEEGILNFYKFNNQEVVHVNYGVGIRGSETENQVMDASEGTTWQTGRNTQDMQNPKAQSNKVNKTWAPFSTKTLPDFQARIDFSKLQRKEEN